MTQLALNNRKMIIIENSLFYANFGQHLNLFIEPKQSLQAINILQDIKDLRQLCREIIRNIEYNQKRTELYINKRKKEEISA